MVARKRTPAKPKKIPKAPIQRPAETSGEPTVEVVRTKSNLATWVLVALAVGAFGFNVYKWQTQGGVTPQPQPKPASVEQVAKDAIKDLAEGYSKSFSDAAVLVLEGKIKTDSELFQSLKPSNDKARSAAFAGMDKLIQDGLPRDSDKLKPEAADFLEAIAKAYGKAVR